MQDFHQRESDSQNEKINIETGASVKVMQGHIKIIILNIQKTYRLTSFVGLEVG